MLRERVTWFAIGAATTTAIAFLVMSRSGERSMREAEPITRAPEAVDRVATPPPTQYSLSRVHDSARMPAVATSPVAPPEDSPPSTAMPAADAAPSSPQSLRDGRQIVSRALATGQWTNQDAAALAAVSGRLSADDRRDLYGKLAVAINQDRVHVEGGLLPR